MTIEIHGLGMSTCVQRVLITAAEIGVDVKVVPIDFAARFNSEHLEHQPFHAIPWLVDTEAGFETYESRAISKYLAAKAGSSLIPGQGDLIKLAKFDTALSVEQSNFDPSASGIVAERVFKKMMGRGEPDEARVAQLKTTLSDKLDGYERILSKQPYLSGQEITLADIFHAPYGNLLFAAGEGSLITDRPAVNKWWESIRNRESVKKVLDTK